MVWRPTEIIGERSVVAGCWMSCVWNNTHPSPQQPTHRTANPWTRQPADPPARRPAIGSTCLQTSHHTLEVNCTGWAKEANSTTIKHQHNTHQTAHRVTEAHCLDGWLGGCSNVWLVAGFLGGLVVLLTRRPRPSCLAGWRVCVVGHILPHVFALSC